MQDERQSGGVQGLVAWLANGLDIQEAQYVVTHRIPDYWS